MKKLASLIFFMGFNSVFSQIFTSTDLPLIILETNNQTIVNNPKIAATMKIIDYGSILRNHPTDIPNIYNGNIGIELRGNFSQTFPQKSYGIETRDNAGLPIDTSLLGIARENDWCLINCYNDKTFCRNLLSYELFRSMGHYAANFRYCEVMLNGSYVGVYLFGENIKRDKNRVDIAKLDSTENTYPDISGGYITRIDDAFLFNSTIAWQLTYHPVDHPSYPVYMEYFYPKPDKITPAQTTYLHQFFDNMEGALYSTNFADTVSGYRKYLSVKSFIDFFILNELSRNVDGFKKSCFFHKEKDNVQTGAIGKLKAGPVWDADWAWNDIGYCANVGYANTDGSGWSHMINDCFLSNSPGYYVRLLQDTLFANELNCRWKYLRGGLLDTVNIFHFIDSLVLRVNEGQQRHFALYNTLGQITGTWELDLAYTYPGEIDSLKAWIARRIVWMDANMPGTCTLSGENYSSSLVSNAVGVYPNPFADDLYITVNLNKATDVFIKILDITGKEIVSPQLFSGLPGTNNFHLQIADKMLANGMYLLRVDYGEGMYNRSVICSER